MLMYTTPLFIFVDLSAIYSTMLHDRLNMGERNRLSCWNSFATPDIELCLNAKHNNGLRMEHIRASLEATLDVAIGRVLASHRRGGRHCQQIWPKTQNTNKNYF